MIKNKDRQIEDILTRGVSNIIPNKSALIKRIKSDKPLNVYLGIDPTATHIHIGHAVALRKLQEFVALGANVTFLIGDTTALIGDTSDKETERPILTVNEIKNNFKTYKKQASKILDFSKVKVVFNSHWLNKLKFPEIIKLCQEFSFGDFASRELIKKRLNNKKRVGLHEAIYPVMQGYDSYHLDTDIQIGGADQTFNMQAGRQLLKARKNKESFILVTEYLTGTDGRKMSKSWGNAIWLDDSADQIFAKIMSLPDELIIEYFKVSTNLPISQINQIEKALLTNSAHPMEVKKRLAFEIASELTNKKSAASARANFEKRFQKKEPEFDTKIKLMTTFAETIAPYTNLKSSSDAKRLILQGGVTVDGDLVTDVNFKLKKGQNVKIGKKIFAKII